MLGFSQLCGANDDGQLLTLIGHLSILFIYFQIHKYSGAYFYNMLPPKIRSSSSFPAFKRRAHELFLDMFINDS